MSLVPIVFRLTPAVLLVCLVSLANAQDFEVYVSDAGNFNNPPWQILKFDANGANPQVFTTDNLAWPQDILFLEDQGVVLISNLNSNRINRHDAESGDFIDIFAADSSGPTRMKIGPDGLIYVLQWTGDGLVKRYAQDGTPAADFTATAISQSIGLDWDSNGALLVSSFNQANVRRFDAQGADQGLFISGNLVGPTNLYFTDTGQLLVLDWNGGAVRRFNADGSFESNFITGLIQPEGIATMPGGDLLIGDGGRGSVKRYDAAGNLQGDFIAAGAGGLLQPNAVVIRPLGEPFEINAGLNDAWIDPATPGQGFLITAFPDIQQVFLAWFTFEVSGSGKGASLGGASQRWLTAQGGYQGDTAEMTISVTRGGVFGAAQPVPTTTADGTLKLRFSGCEAGLVDYSIQSLGLSGQIPISRITADNVSLCESLASP